MKRIGFIILAILIFLLSWTGGSIYSIYTFPDKAFQRVFKTHKDIWKFTHKNELVDDNFRTVVRPALDFLYSSAALDAKDGVHVLSIPPIDRYFVFQFMEDDTDVFDYVGSRKYGKNKALDILIVPKNYVGKDYGLPIVKLKSDQVWLLARYQLFGHADLENIQAIQKEVKLTPIKEYIAAQ